MKIEKNGLGKEYYKNGKIQFEGEYYNGKRWNGKGYNFEGKEEYELKYGKGKIKEYNYNGQLLYEGDYVDGKRCGQGKEYYILSVKEKIEQGYLNLNASTYIPRNNILRRIGKEPDLNEEGIEIIDEKLESNDNNQIKFKGEYLNGERNGKGKEYYVNW